MDSVECPVPRSAEMLGAGEATQQQEQSLTRQCSGLHWPVQVTVNNQLGSYCYLALPRDT